MFEGNGLDGSCNPRQNAQQTKFTSKLATLNFLPCWPSSGLHGIDEKCKTRFKNKLTHVSDFFRLPRERGQGSSTDCDLICLLVSLPAKRCMWNFSNLTLHLKLPL